MVIASQALVRGRRLARLRTLGPAAGAVLLRLGWLLPGAAVLDSARAVAPTVVAGA